VDTGPNFCHFDLTQSQNFATDLAMALQQIANTVVPCIYDVVPPDGGTFDPDKVNLYYTSGGQLFLIIQNASSTCDLGWHYTDASKTQIEICGSTCDQIKSDPGGRLEVEFGCEPVALVF
jgi:hypothetical protein